MPAAGNQGHQFIVSPDIGHRSKIQPLVGGISGNPGDDLVDIRVGQTTAVGQLQPFNLVLLLCLWPS